MAFLIKKLGIDLGTTNTRVYVPEKGIVLNEPSVVAISKEDGQILAIGNKAKEMIGKTPDEIIAYRPIRDGVIANYRVTEAMLKYYINKVLPRFNIFKPEVMISVPSGITGTERRSVIEAAIKSGAKNAYIVKEPVLAAIGAGIPIHEASGRIIVDVGGGMTDVAVISLGGIVCSKSVKFAGQKMDKAIVDYMKKNHNLIIGEQTAEDMKIEIGSALPLEEEMTMEVKGRDGNSGLPKSIEVKTNEITKAIDKELKQIILAIKSVLQETPPELSRDIIDNGIIMSGGSSLLRYFPILVERRTGVKADLATDTIFCVSKGTGLALAHLDVYKKSILSKR
ncbi:MAG TPA: rod shape-determining protein [Candidatus Paceibacterota bacterium]|nr:rod shape-determining protein [Candidatus Paceibacterota bacterium]HQB57065.1 rod shape-determining protein [Candidatus Paceibacterota bacterium]